MAGEELSPEVKRFITSTINSVEQLEVLLFLMSNPERGWSADEVSSRTRLSPESVSAKLSELHHAQLLTVSNDVPPQYCYAPKSKVLAQEVADSLNQAFKERKDTVIQLIFSRPMSNIRVFADAFRIRRDDE